MSVSTEEYFCLAKFRNVRLCFAKNILERQSWQYTKSTPGYSGFVWEKNAYLGSKLVAIQFLIPRNLKYISVRQCQHGGTCMVEEAVQSSASDADEEARTCANPWFHSTMKRAAKDERSHHRGPAPTPAPLLAAKLQKRLSPLPRLASHPTTVHRYTSCFLVAET